MKRRIPLWTLCFILLLSGEPSLIFSQEASTEKVWTLAECIQTALRNRPELEISDLDISQAEFQIKEAQSYYYPRLNLTAGYTRFSSPEIIDTNVDISALTKEIRPIIFSQTGFVLPLVLHEEFEVGKTKWAAVFLDANQPLYSFGRIDEAVKQARIGRSLAVNQKQKKRAEIILEVKKGYYQFLAAQEMLQLLKEAEAKANVVSRMVKIAYETAVPEEKPEKGATRLDYLKSRNFLSEVKAKLSEMSKNVKLAELGLRMAIGLEPDGALKVPDASFEGLPLDQWALGELREKTLEKNIDLKSVDMGVQFFDSKRKTAKKEYLPKIGLQGQYVGPEDRFGNKNIWWAGIGFTVPLFDGFQRRAKIGQAEAQFQKIKGQKLILEKALSAQIDQLNTNLMELKERIRIVQEAIQEARERMGLASDGYAAGITEYEDLLLAQKAELEARSIGLQLRFNYQMTKSEIEFISEAP
jgi:outer membrane protein